MEFTKVSDFEWEIAATEGMRVPGKIFASKELLDHIVEGRSVTQVQNVARLPGILKASIAMPDAHQGYGFSIGGVAAFDIETGVISPGGIGYDINCSVRLLKTNLVREDLKGREREIVKSLFKAVPSGVGKPGRFDLDFKTIDEILMQGASWMVENGYGIQEDLEFIEENGCMKGADPVAVSDFAKTRGSTQMGTLGAGNHFLDVLIVDEIFDPKTANVYGLKKDQVVVMIHCGSRGLGHQVATDYINLMRKEYGSPNFDKELVYAPITSPLGKQYYSAMVAAANFAFANKQLITHYVREDLKKFFPEFRAEIIYDICHNIAKFEKHSVGGQEKRVLVMRKGATRSFGPDREEIPEKYCQVGQPVFLPGSMGTASYVLAGTAKAEELSMGSTAHGAGRIKSRTQIRQELDYETAKAKMESLGVYVESGSHRGRIEESPESYKDIEEVVRVSDSAGIGRKVARLMPLLVVVG